MTNTLLLTGILNIRESIIVGVFQGCRAKNHEQNGSGRSDDLYRTYQ